LRFPPVTHKNSRENDAFTSQHVPSLLPYATITCYRKCSSPHTPSICTSNKHASPGHNNTTRIRPPKPLRSLLLRPYWLLLERYSRPRNWLRAVGLYKCRLASSQQLLLRCGKAERSAQPPYELRTKCVPDCWRCRRSTSERSEHIYGVLRCQRVQRCHGPARHWFRCCCDGVGDQPRWCRRDEPAAGAAYDQGME
jgi:hypothetical protein